MPDGELRELLLAVTFGLGGGLLGVLLTLGTRWVNNEPVLPLRRPSPPITSSRIYYIGMALFGGLAVLSLAMNRPIFACLFVLAVAFYALGLASFRTRNRG